MGSQAAYAARALRQPRPPLRGHIFLETSRSHWEPIDFNLKSIDLNKKSKPVDGPSQGERTLLRISKYGVREILAIWLASLGNSA